MNFALSFQRFIIICALYLLSGSTYGQAFTQYNFNQAGGSFNYRIEPFEEDMDGSPYYADEWRAGTVYLTNDTYVELEQLKYNVYLDEIVFLFKGKQYIIPNKTEISKLELGDETFIGAFSGKNDYSFFQVIDGNANFYLLKGYDCRVMKGEPSKGYTPGTKDRYVLKDDYYIKSALQNAIKINPRQGYDVLDYMDDDKRKEVNSYIKSNKLKMRKLEELAEVVRYYSKMSSVVK